MLFDSVAQGKVLICRVLLRNEVISSTWLSLTHEVDLDKSQMLIFNPPKPHFPHSQTHMLIVQISKIWMYQKDATKYQKQKQTSGTQIHHSILHKPFFPRCVATVHLQPCGISSCARCLKEGTLGSHSQGSRHIWAAPGKPTLSCASDWFLMLRWLQQAETRILASSYYLSHILCSFSFLSNCVFIILGKFFSSVSYDLLTPSDRTLGVVLRFLRQWSNIVKRWTALKPVDRDAGLIELSV